MKDTEHAIYALGIIKPVTPLENVPIAVLKFTNLADLKFSENGRCAELENNPEVSRQLATKEGLRHATWMGGSIEFYIISDPKADREIRNLINNTPPEVLDPFLITV